MHTHENNNRRFDNIIIGTYYASVLSAPEDLGRSRTSCENFTVFSLSDCDVNIITSVKHQIIMCQPSAALRDNTHANVYIIFHKQLRRYNTYALLLY